MIIQTPPLSVRSVNVVPALFQAQLPDTLNVIRQAIPEWTAVHVVAPGGTGKRGATPEDIKKELVSQLQPQVMLFDPIYTLTTPEIPAGTIATLVPDRVKPTFAAEYEGWKFIVYKDARARLKDFLTRALGGIPEGHVSLADALVKNPTKGQVAIEGWSGSIAIPSFKRTMEAIIDPTHQVMFWDSAFGFAATGETFLQRSDHILGMLGSKSDRVYFDAKEFSWYVAFCADAQMRAAMIG